MKTAWLNIVILVYQRPNSLLRLLKSLDFAFTECDEQVNLTFSLDGNYRIENEQVIADFSWKLGQVGIHKNPSNLGVDQHFLQCIERCTIQDFTLILEDDNFLVQAVLSYIQYFRDNSSVFAGASLHHYPIHPITDLPFVPLQNGNDFYAAKRISSRGLLLNSRQAQAFLDWKKNYSSANFKHAIPSYLSKYTDKVWETLFTKFLIETDQYVLFPHQSALSVFGEKGVHFRQTDDRFVAQSPLTLENTPVLNTNSPLIHYDAWLEIEPDSLNQIFDHVKSYDYEVDLYGTKSQITKPYILTTKDLKNPIMQFGMDLKPIELNVIYQIQGHEINFGKTEKILPDSSSSRAKRKLLFRWYFHQRHSTKELMYHLWQRLLNNRFYQFSSSKKKNRNT